MRKVFPLLSYTIAFDRRSKPYRQRVWLANDRAPSSASPEKDQWHVLQALKTKVKDVSSITDLWHGMRLEFEIDEESLPRPPLYYSFR